MEIVSHLIRLMDDDHLKGIIKLTPADLWGGVHVWILALVNMVSYSYFIKG